MNNCIFSILRTIENIYCTEENITNIELYKLIIDIRNSIEDLRELNFKLISLQKHLPDFSRFIERLSENI